MMTNRKTQQKHITNIWQREVGKLSPKAFQNREVASEDIVSQLSAYKFLARNPDDYVKSINFNPRGNILLSASKDNNIVLWDWENKRNKFPISSHHCQWLSKAKFLHHANDRNIVYCADDGQVRHIEILEGGKVEDFLIGKHRGGACDLAIEPGSPYVFYSCGHDGFVKLYDLRISIAARRMRCGDHLSVVSLNPRNPNLFAVDGGGEYTQVYDIRRYKPNGSNKLGQPVSIYGPSYIRNLGIHTKRLAFSEHGELLVSYTFRDRFGFLSMFTNDMESGPSQTPPVSNINTICPTYIRVIPKAHGTGVCDIRDVKFFGPKCEYVVCLVESGYVYIYRKQDGKIIHRLGPTTCLKRDRFNKLNCIETHPHETLLATGGTTAGIKIWIPKGKIALYNVFEI